MGSGDGLNLVTLCVAKKNRNWSFVVPTGWILLIHTGKNVPLVSPVGSSPAGATMLNSRNIAAGIVTTNVPLYVLVASAPKGKLNAFNHDDASLAIFGMALLQLSTNIPVP